MISKEATIRNESGFHIRPAQLFVEKAGKFEATISIKANEMEADGKSILGLMSLGLGKGQTIIVSAEGSDEQEAADTLVQLIEDGFGEA